MSIDKVTYWIDIADYDIETAEAMYSTQRWLYVAFMCHQSIEKDDKSVLVWNHARGSALHAQSHATG